MYVDCLLQQIIVFILTKFNLDRERLNRATKLKLNLQLDEQLVKEVETDFTIFEDCVSNYFLAAVECKGTCADEAVKQIVGYAKAAFLSNGDGATA